jgi:hypothetical protein
LTATSTGTQVGLAWAAATDNVGVAGYSVERCQGVGCSAFVEIASPAGLTYTDAGLAVTTSYSYRIRAADAAALFGPYSNIATVVTAGGTTPGLVAAYGFDEGAGTSATDASGSGNAGTLLTGTVWNAAGRFGGALQFNGASAGVTVPDSGSLDLTTGMTLEAWVYPTSLPVGWRNVVGKDIDRYYLMAGSNNSTPATGGTYSVGGNANTYAPSPLAVNAWTHLAATFDGTSVRLFVNGVQVTSRAQTGALTTSAGLLTIGYDSYGEYFTGLIDEVRVYNRALSVGEIQSDMATAVGSGGPRLTITQPAESASVVGPTIAIAYTTAGDLTGVDHVHFQLDSSPEVMDLTLDGASNLTNVAAGSHVLRGYLARADHSKITGTDTLRNFVSTLPDTTAPSAPGTLTATATATQIALAWGAATDNVGVTGYRVERCQGVGCTTFVQIAAPTGLTYTDTGLAAATSYSYRVRAIDAAALLGPYANTATLATGAAPSGLVAAYAFDEGAGTAVTDASGNGNTGTVLTGTTWTATGRFGGALVFNGSTGGVSIPNAPSLGLTTGMTLEAWVYPTVLPAGWRNVVGKDIDRYYLMAGSGHTVPATGGTFTSGNANTYAPSALAVNAWTHLAATFDGTATRIFVNGVQVATQAQNGTLTTSTALLTIGYDSYGERFIGLIDDVRVYNRALSVTELQTDMTIAVR